MVLASASYVTMENQSEGLEAGADGYIARPVANRELLARVGAFMRLVQLTKELRLKTEALEQDIADKTAAQLASLNLMEDALSARERLEGSNAQLLQEIAERKRAEVQLRQLSRLVEQAPLAIAITDLTGAIEYVNPNFLASTGYTFEEVIGQNPRVLKSGLTPPETYQVMWETLTRGEVWRGEFSNKKKNGEFFDELAVVAPVTDERGKVTHFVALKQDITSRKRAEEMLRESEERFRAITRAASDAIVTADSAGRICEWNTGAEHLFGHRADEIRGQPLEMIIPPHYREAHHRGLSRVQAGGEMHLRDKSVELVGLHRDGHEFPLELSLAQGETSVGGFFVAIIRDISDRKRDVEALRESEARFRELFDLVSDAILVFETETGRIIQANAAAAQIYGWPLAHLLTLTRHDFTLKSDSAINNSLRQLTENIGEPVRITNRKHLRADGSVFPVAASMRSFHRGGKILAVAVVRDITEQLLAQEQLERFNTELERKVALRTQELSDRSHEIEVVLQSVPDLVMRLRTDGTVLNVRPAKGATTLAVISQNQDELVTKRLHELLAQAALPHVQRARAENASVTAESEVALATGLLPTELHVAPLGSDELVIFARDITERKLQEANIRDMLEKERQISEMKTRFISVTSHEFRTPMSAAMGSTEILTNHFELISPEKRQELLARITTSLHRMTEMLDEILLLNRIDAKRVEVRLAPIDLRYFVRNAIEEIRLGDREGHVFDLNVVGDVAHFVTDANLLHHILSNILSNAVRYSPAGTLIIIQLAVDACGVRLSIEDQGIGVPEADRARIFEAFERGSNVGTKKGTGLGLSIVKRMTEMLSGTVSLTARERGGSRFTLEFPHTDMPAPQS